VRRGPFHIIVPGKPPRKDAWTRNISGGKRGRALTKDALGWISELELVWRTCGEDIITWSDWSLDLKIYVQLMRKVEDERFPWRDVDSAISPVMDALQRAGVIDNDLRIDRATLRRAHDPVNPRTVILLTQLGPDDFDD